MRIIKGLNFKCQNHNRGCLTELPVTELTKHESKCDFKAPKQNGIIGFASCQVCNITVTGGEAERKKHLCFLRRNQYANSMCQDHCQL